MSEPMADTPPAVAYDPVTAETSRTVPMPSIAIGNRPMNPAMTKPLTPGMPNKPRYGPTTIRDPFRTSYARACR